MMLDKIDDDLKYLIDPNWQIASIHVMSQEQFDLATSPDTSPEIKHLIYMGSFVGNQWVRVENGEEPTLPQVYIDSPISDWEFDTDEPE